MTHPYDALQEAVRVVGAAVGSPGEKVPVTTVTLEAVASFGHPAESWEGWHTLAMGLLNLNQVLLAQHEAATGQAPLDVLSAIAAQFPRTEDP